MLGARRIALCFAVLCGLLMVGGCTASRFGTGDGTSVAAPVKGAAARFAFAPIEGVPVPVLQAMSNALNQDATAFKLNVVPYNDPSAVYFVRGYLSAVAEGPNAKLVYVWDVFDRQGARLHRVTGQEMGGAFTGGDPWTGIGAANINAASRRTMDNLAKWVN